jgi:hypothetical protein
MVTIDDVNLDWTPGSRVSKGALRMTVRASRGGRNTVELPENARLQLVKIDGRDQPIGQEGARVVIPLEPRRQVVELEWNQPSESGVLMRGPGIDLGQPAVNARVNFQLSSDSWVLWTGGPALGPAVLFWSHLIVVTLVALGLGRETLTPLKTHHWLLLGLGLTQVSAPSALVVAGWLLALGFREKKRGPENAVAYNFTQLALVVLTLAALFNLYEAIENGLLGIPDMRIAGNGSGDFSLYWTADRIDGALPRPWALSLHLAVYHFLMLIWALWLAFSLLKWLRWGWHCMSDHGLWKKIRFRKKKDQPPPIK